jgi:hypothetical protein
MVNQKSVRARRDIEDFILQMAGESAVQIQGQEIHKEADEAMVMEDDDEPDDFPYRSIRIYEI